MLAESWRPGSLAALLSWQDWPGFDLGGQGGPALFSSPTPTPTAATTNFLNIGKFERRYYIQVQSVVVGYLLQLLCVARQKDNLLVRSRTKLQQRVGEESCGSGAQVRLGRDDDDEKQKKLLGNLKVTSIWFKYSDQIPNSTTSLIKGGVLLLSTVDWCSSPSFIVKASKTVFPFWGCLLSC